MLSLQNQQQVKRAGIQRRIIITQQHIEEILGKRKFLLGVANVQRFALRLMPEHIVGIGYDGREFGREFNALAHQVVARNIIRRGIVSVELQHTARQYVHDVRTLQLHDVEHRFRHQRHIVHQQPAELLQLLRIWQSARQQEKSHLLKPETSFCQNSACQIRNLVSSEVQFTFYGNKSFSAAFISHHIAYVGQSYQNAGTVFVAQSALYIQFTKQCCINFYTALHSIGQFVNKILLFVSHKSAL